MNEGFDSSLLRSLSRVVTQRTGLRFAPDRHSDLERGVRAAAQALGFASADACAAWLVSSVLTTEQVRTLAAHLTVGETYFFREKGAFDFLEQRVFPDLIAARRGLDRRLRIWSAGCCTGEEPYSIAISLLRILPDPAEWQIQILGTDINEQFLQTAREATYGEWSFRDALPAGAKNCFVRAECDRRRLVPELCRHVTFAPLNLIDDVYPSPANGTEALDLILCRNVLIYMGEEQSHKIVRNLGRCLNEGGWLLVGAADGSQVKDADLSPAEAAGVMAFQKTSAGSAAPPRRVSRGISRPVDCPSTAESAVAMPHSLVGSALRTVSGDGVTVGAADSAGSTAFSRRVGVLAHRPLPQTKMVGEYTHPTFRPGRTTPRNGDGCSSTTTDVRLTMARAEIAYREQRYADAIAMLLLICTAANPSSATAALLARAYANQGKKPEALAWCERAIRVEKLDSRLYYLKASILQEQGDTSEAAAAFRRAIYLDADFVMAHVAAGHLAGRLGRMKESARHLHTARRLLDRYRPDQSVPEAEGIDAQQLARLIAADPMIGAAA